MARVSRAAALVTATREWRMRATQLAAEHKLLGQAARTDEQNVYTCISASEPDDHVIVFNPVSGTITCDCHAADNILPCGHAGAVLQLVVGCAPERVRDARGYTHE